MNEEEITIHISPEMCQGVTVTQGNHTEMTRERDSLEQIQDNSRAIETVTTVLQIITMFKDRDPGEDHRDFHEILERNHISSGLCTALRSLSQYSYVLAGEAIKDMPAEDEDFAV